MTARIKGKWVIIDYSEIENTPDLSAYDAHIDTSAIHFEKTDIDYSDIQNTPIELFKELSDDNHSPHGFIKPVDNVNATFNDVTRTLTLSPIGSEYVFWSSGKRFKKTENDSIVIDDITSNYYIYYNDSGELVSSNTFSLDMIVKYAIVAIIYWNAEDTKHILFCHEYLHTTEMGGMTHANLHLTKGFTLERGGALGDFIFGNGNLNSHIQFSNELTVAWDEDAKCNLPPRLSTDNISVYWKEGSEANPIWKVKEDTSFPVFIETGNTYPSYNQLVAGNWQLTQLGNNNHMLIHVACNNDLNRRFMVFLGQENYGSSVTNVRENATEELDNLILEGMIAPEFRFLGTIIVQATGANDVNARFRSIDAETDYIDWRTVSVGRGGVSGNVVDHEQLANRNVDDAHKSFAISYDNINSSLSATNVEDALDELDYEKLNKSDFENYVSLLYARNQALSAYDEIYAGGVGDGSLVNTGWVMPFNCYIKKALFKTNNCGSNSQLGLYKNLSTEILSTTISDAESNEIASGSNVEMVFTFDNFEANAGDKIRMALKDWCNYPSITLILEEK